MAVRLSASRAFRPLPPGKFLVPICVRGWVNPRAIVRLEGLGKLKKRGRLCRVTAASFYVNTSLRVEGNKFGVLIQHIYCSLLFNINLFRTGRWYGKSDTYGEVCTETFLVNVRSLHVLPWVVDAELLQSKLNLDFIKFTHDLFCVTSVLKSPHNKVGVSESGFMLGNINLMASK
jgi:hypothetical protein